MTPSASQTMPGRLDVETLREWLAPGDAPRVLDVQSASEFATAHLPGSYNVPLDLPRSTVMS